jgi:hypothetical protein
MQINVPRFGPRHDVSDVLIRHHIIYIVTTDTVRIYVYNILYGSRSVPCRATATGRRHCSPQRHVRPSAVSSRTMPYHTIFDLFFYFYFYTTTVRRLRHRHCICVRSQNIPFAIWIGFFIGRRIIFMRRGFAFVSLRPRCDAQTSVRHAVFVLTCVECATTSRQPIRR